MIHIRFILENFIRNLDKRRLNFALMVIVSGVTVFLLDMVFMIKEESYYHIRSVKESLKQNESCMNIRVFPDAGDFDFTKKLSDFDVRLEEEFGDDYGAFMEMNIRFFKEESKEGMQNGVVYIDRSVFDLCEISLKEGNSINAMKENHSYMEAYVGYDLKEQYPVGTVLENSYTGSKTKIVGVMEKESCWLPTLLFGTTETRICLDDKIVSELDESIFKTSDLFYNNICNSMYLKCDSKEEAFDRQEAVRKIAEEQGLLSYQDTIAQLIKKEKENHRQIFQSVGILTIFVTTLACVALFASSAADVYSRRYDIGLMYIYGISKVDIFIMTWIENLLKLLIPFGVAVLLYGRNLEGERLLIHGHIVIWEILLLLFVVSVLISWIACAMVNRKDITKLVSSVE